MSKGFGFAYTPVGVIKEGKYLLHEKDAETPYICLTPNDYGLVSEFAEKRLKQLINALMANLNTAVEFMAKLCKTFNIKNIQQHLPASGTLSDQTIYLSFPAWSIIQDFIYLHRIQYLDSVLEISKPMFKNLKILLDMLKTFNSNNSFLNKDFKLQITNDFFGLSPGSKYVTNNTVFISYVNRLANHAVISLPLLHPVVEYKIVPFVTDNQIFKYKYFIQSPMFDYVSDSPLSPTCSSMFSMNCNQIVDTVCAKAFLRSKIDEVCMKSATNFKSINILSCKGAGESALVVSIPKVMEATLDCFQDKDFLLTLQSGTTWLKPCMLKSNNNIISPMLGSIPYDIKSAYSSVNPVISADYDNWKLVYITVGLIVLFVMTTALTILGTTLFIRHRQNGLGQLAIQANAPDAGIPMQVINYNLQGAQGLQPPSSGFIAPID